MKDYRDVRINVDGENILTISSNHLCGVDNINDYKDDIKELALSLLSFIGEPSEVGVQPEVMPNEVLAGVRKCKTCKFIKDRKMCALFYSENGFMQYCSGYKSQCET